jgi:NHS family xanthosine MFS transporter
MAIKRQLIAINFLQFFIWGSWLLTIGAYWFENKHWPAKDFGLIFSTMGIAALVMPTLTGFLADRWISAQKLYGILHILGGIGLLSVPMAQTPTQVFWIILATMFCYMPTIPLSNTIGYTFLKGASLDILKHFPHIRVWGTLGFIAALWTVSLSQIEQSSSQFYLGGVVAIILGVISFWSLPDCPPLGKVGSDSDSKTLKSIINNPQFVLFFIFSMLLGAALQLTNAYGDAFISSFAHIPEFSNSLAVKYPAMIMSISQISETLFILAIPFFMKRFSIKQVMLISMVAWVLRFALFSFGDTGNGLWMIILSCIVYGMAFDFFNVSGSLYIEQNVDEQVRSRAQGIFTMMVNGFGAILGSLGSGYLIEKFFTTKQSVSITSYDWPGIWMSFALYALAVTVLFALLFKSPVKITGKR